MFTHITKLYKQGSMKKLTEFLKKCLTFVKSLTIKDLVYVCIILLVLGAAISLYECNRSAAKKYENNIEALTDSIEYYKSKSGDLVAKKTAFQVDDVDELKQLNDSLYQELQDMKGIVKTSKVVSGVTSKVTITNTVRDTCYVIQHDTIRTKGFDKQFAFNDEWRDLEGTVGYHADTLGLHIGKDITRFSYTVVIDSDNKLYIKSKNPYVTFDEFTGFTIPSQVKQKTKRWGVGPHIGFGYDFVKKCAAPYIGIGIQYNILQF